MHGDCLYAWCQTKGGLPDNPSRETYTKYHQENNIGVVNKHAPAPNNKEDAICSNFYYYSDDIIFYMTTKTTEVG